MAINLALLNAVPPMSFVEQRRSLEVRGVLVPLTWAQMSFVLALRDAAGEPVTRAVLSEVALRRKWRGGEDRAVDQLAFSVRQGLARHGLVDVVHTVRGVGFWMAAT